MGMERVKAHFEEAAQEFDDNILKLIPHYGTMIDALISVIPFSVDRKFSMIDLGCGTGTISKAVQSAFPDTDITCVDIAERMLEMARTKLSGTINCIQADFNSFEFPHKYHLAVSSLALHHLENDIDKLGFYRKIYESLTDDGIFINIDVVLGGDDTIQDVYMARWKDFLSQNVSKEVIINKVMPDYYAEDRPIELLTHLDMLKECGFSCVDVIYKYFNFAVYIGKK